MRTTLIVAGFLTLLAAATLVMALLRAGRAGCSRSRRSLRRRAEVRGLPSARARALGGIGSCAGHADRGRRDGARRLRRPPLHSGLRDLHVLPSRGPIHGSDGRTGRQAGRLRDQVHVRRDAAPAIPRRATGRPAAGAVDRLGRAPARVGWPALVPSLSEREDRLPRRAPLDPPAAELELHVRGLPLDERPQELRRGSRSLRHDVVGDQRGLRGVSRSGLPPRGLGGDRASRPNVRRERRQGADGGPARASERAVDHRLRVRQREAQRASDHRGRARRVRPVSRPAKPDLVRVRRGPAVPRSLRARAAHGAALLARRTAARRSLQLGIVPGEPHARRRRDVQRLPRAPRAEAPGAGQPGVRPVPRGGEVRHRRAPFSPARRPGRRVRRLPHAE